MKNLILLLSLVFIACATAPKMTKVDVQHCSKPKYAGDPCSIKQINKATYYMSNVARAKEMLTCGEDITQARAEYAYQFKKYTVCIEKTFTDELRDEAKRCGTRPVYKGDSCTPPDIFDHDADYRAVIDCLNTVTRERAAYMRDLRQYTTCLEGTIKN